jgi:hypothetical protein
MPIRKLRIGLLSSVLVLLGGCAVAQSRPPPRPPIRDVARAESAQVITVRDTLLDLSTGRGRSVTAHTPIIPAGPIGVRLPVTVGGEKKVEVPAEEITVQFKDGKRVAVVQELSSPPFAPGERVKVVYEVPNDVDGTSRMLVVRE